MRAISVTRCSPEMGVTLLLTPSWALVLLTTNDDRHRRQLGANASQPGLGDARPVVSSGGRLFLPLRPHAGVDFVKYQGARFT
jgi:hypothetical protein